MVNDQPLEIRVEGPKKEDLLPELNRKIVQMHGSGATSFSSHVYSGNPADGYSLTVKYVVLERGTTTAELLQREPPKF